MEVKLRKEVVGNAQKIFFNRDSTSVDLFQGCTASRIGVTLLTAGFISGKTSHFSSIEYVL